MQTVKRIVGTYSVSGMCILTAKEFPLEVNSAGRCLACDGAGRIYQVGNPKDLGYPCRACRNEL